MLNIQNEHVVRGLLNDDQLLNFKLNQALELLSNLKQNLSESSSKILSTSKKSSTKTNINNLQAINLLLFDLVQLNNKNTSKKTLNLNDINQSVSDLSLKTFKKRSKTINEIIAIEMLEQFDWIKSAIQAIKYETDEQKIGDFTNPTDSLDKLEALIKKIRSHKNSRFARLFMSDCLADGTNLLINVCNNCKGDIKIV
jgi:hypothetical protein